MNGKGRGNKRCSITASHGARDLRSASSEASSFVYLKNDMDDKEERVRKIVVEQLGVKPAEVTPDARFVEDLGADSLDTVELVMALEEEFGIEIADEDAERMHKVKDVYRYLEERLGE